MTTPSGTISLDNVRSEFSIAGPISLSALYKNGSHILRNCSGVPTSGTISFSQLRSLTKGFLWNTSVGGINNFSARPSAIAAGWNQSSPLVANITVGGHIGSTSTSTPAFTDVGSYPSESSYVVTINGGCYIVGQGGHGGDGGIWGYQGDTTGKAGGPAMYLSGTGISKTFINNGVIGGGGGGGAGGYGCTWNSGYGGRYGGAGGGGAGYGIGGNRSGGPSGGSSGWGPDGSVNAGGGGGGAWICGNAGGAGGGLGSAGGATGQSAGAAGIGASGWGSVSSYGGSGATYGTFS